MAVHVENLTSEVIPEPESASQAAAGAPDSEQLDKARWARSRLARDRARVAAEGFDD